MKNNRAAIGPAATSDAPLGPLPAVGGLGLSPKGESVLAALQGAGGPLSLAALGTTTGLHVNTLRDHLDQLMERGLVERASATPSGRGRPALLYAASSPAATSSVLQRPGAAAPYARLASALAASIHRNSDAPTEEAAGAGEEWGRELAGDRPGTHGRGAPAARREVVGLLDDLGFAPEPNATATSMRLTRCPLLAASHEYPDVVCAVHLGLVRGALKSLGQPSDGVDLRPFSEPGACRLLLTPRSR